MTWTLANMQIGKQVYHNLKTVIKKKYGQDACNVGDEGGFAPNIQENDEGLKLLVEAIEKAGYTGKIKIGMDVAASEFCKDKKYDLDFKNEASKPEDYLSGEQLTDVYKKFVSDYPVVTIEDPFDQDDWESYQKMCADMNIQIVGDDLLVTNREWLKQNIAFVLSCFLSLPDIHVLALTYCSSNPAHLLECPTTQIDLMHMF
jgi:enolase